MTLAPFNLDWTNWGYEPADPSVGIFGEGIWHEVCNTDDEGEETDLLEATGPVVDIFANGIPGIEDVIETFTCPGCGAQVSRRTQQPAADFGPDDCEATS